MQDDNKSRANITQLFEKASKIIGQSNRFSNECKEQLYQLIQEAQIKYDGLEFIVDKTVNPAYKVEEELELLELQI